MILSNIDVNISSIFSPVFAETSQQSTSNYYLYSFITLSKGTFDELLRSTLFPTTNTVISLKLTV